MSNLSLQRFSGPAPWLWRMFLLQTLLIATIPVQLGASKRELGQATEERGKSLTRVAEESDLTVTLVTDKESYKLGDVVRISVLLTNQSRQPLFLFSSLDWGESASLSLWVKDAVSGKDVPYDFIADAPSPPPTSREAFIKLLPGHIYGVVLKSTLADLNVRAKGKYELAVDYHSPVPARMGFGLPVRSREQGKITSNRVTITVGD